MAELLKLARNIIKLMMPSNFVDQVENSHSNEANDN